MSSRARAVVHELNCREIGPGYKAVAGVDRVMNTGLGQPWRLSIREVSIKVFSFSLEDSESYE